MTKIDYLMSDIYEMLIVGQHEDYRISMSDLTDRQTDKFLAEINEDISYNIEADFIDNIWIVTLTEDSKRRARKIYTPEVRRNLIKERETLKKEWGI